MTSFKLGMQRLLLGDRGTSHTHLKYAARPTEESPPRLIITFVNATNDEKSSDSNQAESTNFGYYLQPARKAQKAALSRYSLRLCPDLAAAGSSDGAFLQVTREQLQSHSHASSNSSRDDDPISKDKDKDKSENKNKKNVKNKNKNTISPIRQQTHTKLLQTTGRKKGKSSAKLLSYTQTAPRIALAVPTRPSYIQGVGMLKGTEGLKPRTKATLMRQEGQSPMVRLPNVKPKQQQESIGTARLALTTPMLLSKGCPPMRNRPTTCSSHIAERLRASPQGLHVQKSPEPTLASGRKPSPSCQGIYLTPPVPLSTSTLTPRTKERYATTRRFSFRRRREMAQFPLLIISFDGVIGDVSCPALFKPDGHVVYTLRRRSVESLRMLQEQYQIAIMTRMPLRRTHIFLNYMMEHDVYFDGVYRDIRQVIHPAQDYTQILRDFDVTTEQEVGRCVVIGALEVDPTYLRLSEREWCGMKERKEWIAHSLPMHALGVGVQLLPTMLLVPHLRFSHNGNLTTLEHVGHHLRILAGRHEPTNYTGHSRLFTLKLSCNKNPGRGADKAPNIHTLRQPAAASSDQAPSPMPTPTPSLADCKPIITAYNLEVPKYLSATNTQHSFHNVRANKELVFELTTTLLYKHMKSLAALEERLQLHYVDVMSKRRLILANQNLQAVDIKNLPTRTESAGKRTEDIRAELFTKLRKAHVPVYDCMQMSSHNARLLSRSGALWSKAADNELEDLNQAFPSQVSRSYLLDCTRCDSDLPLRVALILTQEGCGKGTENVETVFMEPTGLRHLSAYTFQQKRPPICAGCKKSPPDPDLLLPCPETNRIYSKQIGCFGISRQILH